MTKKIINIIFCIGGLNSLIAGDNFTNLVLGDGQTPKAPGPRKNFFTACEKITQRFSTSGIEESKAEHLPEPILPLNSRISYIDNRLKIANDTLSWIKPPYIDQEIYSELETEFIEIQDTFDSITRHNNASVAKRLDILTSVMSAFEAKLREVIDCAIKEDKKARSK